MLMEDRKVLSQVM